MYIIQQINFVTKLQQAKTIFLAKRAFNKFKKHTKRAIFERDGYLPVPLIFLPFCTDNNFTDYGIDNIAIIVSNGSIVYICTL